MKCPAFVWQRGLKGPRPSIWHVPQTVAVKPITPLQSHDLTEDEAAMTIDQLAVKYPFVDRAKPEPKVELNPPPLNGEILTP